MRVRKGDPKIAEVNVEILSKIHDILKKDPERMYSKEEILNLLASLDCDPEIESVLGELEVASSTNEVQAAVYSKCRGGTVYYKWNKG